MIEDLSVVVKIVPRSRSVSVRVLPNDSVVVTAPRFTPRFVINRFIKEHEEWIRDRQKLVIEKLTSLVEKREKLLLRGREYDFRLSVTSLAEGVKIAESTLTVTAKEENHAQVRQILEKWYRTQASKHFKERA